MTNPDHRPCTLTHYPVSAKCYNKVTQVLSKTMIMTKQKETFVHEFSWYKPEIGKSILRENTETRWTILSILSKKWIPWSQLVEENHPNLSSFKEFSPNLKGLWRCEIEAEFEGYTEDRTLLVLEYSPSRLTLEIPEGFGSIPPGRYWLRHDITKSVIFSRHSIGIEIGIGEENFPEGVSLQSINARSVYDPRHDNDYQIQGFYEAWSDGKVTNLGCQIVPIVPEGGYPRQAFELDEDFDLEATLKERKQDSLWKATNRLIQGLICSGGYYNRTAFKGEWEYVPDTLLDKMDDPVYGTVYQLQRGNYWEIYGSQDAIEACWEVYAQQAYWIEGVYHQKDKPSSISSENSYQWLKEYGPYEWREKKPSSRDSIEARGCVGKEFHEWNARRGGYSPD